MAKEEKDPTLTEALKKEITEKVMASLRAQAPAIFSPKKYMNDVRDRFIQNVGGEVTLNALRRAGIIDRPKRDKKQEEALKRNSDSLAQVRKEITQLRVALQKNQQLLNSLISGIQTNQQQGRPAQTFTPSAIQQTMGRVGVLGGQYLFNKATRQYTTPQGAPVATGAVKEQVAGSGGQEGGFSSLGIGAGALAATGLGFFLRGKYRTKAIGVGARMMKSLGVPRFARRMVMQGVGRTALSMSRRLLLNPYVLGLTAIASLFLPKEIKEMVGDVVKGALMGIGLDETLVDSILKPFEIISKIAEGLKDVLGRLYDIIKAFTTPEGRQRMADVLSQIPGSPAPSLPEAVTGLPPTPYEPPEQPQTPSSQNQKADYDEAKRQLVDTKKILDDKLKIYQRIINRNEFPKTATKEETNKFRQDVEKLVALRNVVENQLKEPPKQDANYKVEAAKLRELSKAINEDTEKIRAQFSNMQRRGDGAPAPAPAETIPKEDGAPSPQQPVEQPAQVPNASPSAQPAPGTAPSSEPSTVVGPYIDDENRVPFEQPPNQGSPPAAGAPIQQQPAPQTLTIDGQLTPPGTTSVLGNPGGQPVPSTPTSPKAGGEPVSPTQNEPPLSSPDGTPVVSPTPEVITTNPNQSPSTILASNVNDNSQPFPNLAQQPQAQLERFATPQISRGEELNDRSRIIAQMRSGPKAQNVSTNFFDNSQRKSSGVDEDDIHHIPSPAASRSDIDADTIFSPVA